MFGHKQVPVDAVYCIFRVRYIYRVVSSGREILVSCDAYDVEHEVELLRPMRTLGNGGGVTRSGTSVQELHVRAVPMEPQAPELGPGVMNEECAVTSMRAAATGLRHTTDYSNGIRGPYSKSQ